MCASPSTCRSAYATVVLRELIGDGAERAADDTAEPPGRGGAPRARTMIDGAGRP
ncbi:MAG: hypothetical protein U0575_15840 [Phycisphaerales bacterium]